jgi:hypothetical protein
MIVTGCKGFYLSSMDGDTGAFGTLHNSDYLPCSSKEAAISPEMLETRTIGSQEL